MHGIELKKQFDHTHTIAISMRVSSQPNFIFLKRKVTLEATVSKAKLVGVHSSLVRRGP
jgi:hypothetical protein